MNIRNITTLEQSKALVEVGLDPKTADFTWVEDSEGVWIIDEVPYEDSMALRDGKIEPAWSLAGLLVILPRDDKWTWTLDEDGTFSITDYRPKGITHFCEGKGDGDYIEPVVTVICGCLNEGILL